jgi:BirA family biotin operon repressor/biotin-[acetyl-CoA-carboxylase] ligase
MIILTDDREYAEHILPSQEQWGSFNLDAADPNLLKLISRLYPSKVMHTREIRRDMRWAYVLAVKHAPSSHFDHLIALSQKDCELPDGTLCLAGAGHKFHGQRHRRWSAVEGNIHLAVSLSPRRIIKNFHAGFPVLVAVSLIDALDAFKALHGRAGIKWVNDILIDGAKVAGFLAHTQSVEDTVLTVILGIGLNVEKTPRIQPDSFVPEVGSLRNFVQDEFVLNQERVLFQLLNSLDKNYDLLLSGRYATLLKSYKERSLVIGHHVKVVSDAPSKTSREITSGTVVDIGVNLELFLKGRKKPVTSGRLILA